MDAGLPWGTGISEGEAILKALESRVSSQGRPTNEGVGLTLVSGLVHQARGWLLIVSGTGVLTMKGGESPRLSVLPEAGGYLDQVNCTMESLATIEAAYQTIRPKPGDKRE